MNYYCHLAGILIFSFIFFNSCTIQKRRYVPGYHIEWKRNFKDSKEDDKTVTQQTQDTSALKGLFTESAKPDSELFNPQKLQKAETVSDVVVLSSSSKRLEKSPVVAEGSGERRVSVEHSEWKAQKNRAAGEMSLLQGETGSTILLSILIIAGLYPLALYLWDGFGRDFNISLLIFIGSLLFGITALIFDASPLFYLFAALSFLCYVAGVIHGCNVIGLEIGWLRFGW